MLIPDEVQRLERQILEKLPRLLEQDEHLRVAIEGVLAEKFPRQGFCLIERLARKGEDGVYLSFFARWDVGFSVII